MTGQGQTHAIRDSRIAWHAQVDGGERGIDLGRVEHLLRRYNRNVGNSASTNNRESPVKTAHSNDSDSQAGLYGNHVYTERAPVNCHNR